MPSKIFDVDVTDSKDMMELFKRFNASDSGSIDAAEMKAALAVKNLEKLFLLSLLLLL